jgi:uncharacterized membrane protein YfhO
LLLPLVGAAIFSLLLSAFYLLPTVIEAPLVNLQTTTQGYFDFRAHFVTVPQLFFSRFWGYGGSTWGDEDGLSLAVGQMQWLVAVVVFCGVILKLVRRKIDSKSLLILVLLFVSILCLFLTHNKSAFFWESFSNILKYIQFPWRFLGVVVFLLSLSAGYLIVLIPKHSKIVSIIVISVTVFLNVSFFREDIWKTVTDTDMQNGNSWVEQTRASIGDYWPIYGPIPNSFANVNEGTVETLHTSNSAQYTIISSESSTVNLPIAYYPGWTGTVNGKVIQPAYDAMGRITVPVQQGSNYVKLILQSTPIEKLGNIISLVSVLSLCFISWFNMHKKKK